MTTTMMLSELLKKVLPDTDLGRIPQMNASERHLLMLKEADRLLFQAGYDTHLAWYLVENVFDEDGELIEECIDDALPDVVADWAIDLSLLLYVLLHHETFDLGMLDEMMGCGNAFDFRISNTALVEWLRRTPHRRLAAYTARVMYNEQINWAVDHNPPVQDLVAQECDRFNAAEEPDDYVRRVLTSLQEVEDHLRRGEVLGLQGDEQVLTDMLWGYLPHDYPENYVAMARELNLYLMAHQPARALLRNEATFAAYEDPIFRKCEELAQQHEVDFDTKTINMPASYVHYWLKDRFYNAPVVQNSPSNTAEL